MVVMCDGKHLLMRAIEPDDVTTLQMLVDEAKKFRARGKRLAARNIPPKNRLELSAFWPGEDFKRRDWTATAVAG